MTPKIETAKIERTSDAQIGATLKFNEDGGGLSFGDILTGLAAQAKEMFGESGVEKILALSNVKGGVGLQSAVPLAVAIGFAMGRGQAGTPTPSPGSRATVPAATPSLADIDYSSSAVADYRRRCAAEGIQPTPSTLETYARLDAKGGPAKAHSATAGSFPALVAAKVATGMTKGAAVCAVAKESPASHREWLMSGQTEKL